jgi:hypothetical protein
MCLFFESAPYVFAKDRSPLDSRQSGTDPSPGLSRIVTVAANTHAPGRGVETVNNQTYLGLGAGAGQRYTRNANGSIGSRTNASMQKRGGLGAVGGIRTPQHIEPT